MQMQAQMQAQMRDEHEKAEVAEAGGAMDAAPLQQKEAAGGQAERDISAAWAGGPDGRVVVDRLLPDLGRLLSARGVRLQSDAN